MGSTPRISQGSLFGEARMQMNESIALTVDSLQAYGSRYDHWSIAWSGGKDSTALVTVVLYLIEQGLVPRPKTLTVMQADTRLELTPLWLAASELREEMRDRGIDVRVVLPPLDHRFLVYLLGRGVAPPNNATRRWCTRQTKVQPMHRALAGVAAELGLGELVPVTRDGIANLAYRGFGERKLLVLTGVRQGESAVRDGRIAMSCGRDGAECGQGWYQEALPKALCDTLAPLLHWRVCHVWAWLRHFAPSAQFGDWSTQLLAEAYGGDEAEESKARTGCVSCPVAAEDHALANLARMPAWAYLAPLTQLRPLWMELNHSHHRLRMPYGERRKDGSLAAKQGRMGPLKLTSREWALSEVLRIQAEVNTLADQGRRPRIDILNAEEESRIRELIAARAFPRKWSGEEPGAELPVLTVLGGQSSLFDGWETSPDA